MSCQFHFNESIFALVRTEHIHTLLLLQSYDTRCIFHCQMYRKIQSVIICIFLLIAKTLPWPHTKQIPTTKTYLSNDYGQLCS